ncbi:hypothetical protein [Celerinatantimonas diazotrophica]|uniref:Uncharacterized protein n=1 Tax=Celerinatantimonas diazotrophica TaxID=412034 RepID=A0A4R1J9B3_9GAMM|nr:hypothetical protein [Celerinatantimonas diazotrophica]TCK47168.1 hypothetical protein EV690_2869 [Celerinatantimonas diazotrophica]CAG9295941.1 hypothetical protein CEDIAZO_01075 [Celerinatantimonas diazotrophica]
MYTENDKSLLIYIADYFVKTGNNSIMVSELETLAFYSEASINKFRALKLVKYDTEISIQIFPSIVSERDKLQTLPDYFKNTKKWWFSKKWAVPITVIFLVLPALKTYIDLVSLLFN